MSYKSFYPNSILDTVVSVNGVTQNPSVPVWKFVQDNSDYFWGSIGCGEVPCCPSTITSITLNDGSNNYTPEIASLVGGRPPHRPHAA